jgi:CHAD domain-containing protein
MKTKDYVVTATDHLAEVLKILCRVNYDNDAQAMHNLRETSRRLGVAHQNIDDAFAKLARQEEGT